MWEPPPRHSMGGQRQTISCMLLLLLVSSFTSPLTSPVIIPSSHHSYTTDDDGNVTQENTTDNESVQWNWTAHAPVWNVGDQWTYDVVLDAVAIVEETAELDGAELEFLYGTGVMTVQAIQEQEVDGVMTPVYQTYTSGNFVGQGRDFPAPVIGAVDGTLNVVFELTEWYRVSDLALTGYSKRLVFTFTPQVIIEGPDIEITDFTENSDYDPPREFYDFPLALNETWYEETNHSSNFSGGDSGLIEVPNGLEHSNEEWDFSVARQVNSSWTGCENSTEVWMHDQAGDPEEWRWWCPAVRQYTHRWTDDIALGGVNASLVLIGYSPATPDEIIEVEMQPDWSPLNAEVNVTIWVNDSAGQPIASASGVVYHGSTMLAWSTDSNGTTHLILPVGNAMDNTPTEFDWGTHGIVAIMLSSQVVGIDTLTLEGSAIGGLLRIKAMEIAAEASEVMARLVQDFEPSVRY